MADICRCGCGEERVYPVGLSRAEIGVLRSVLEKAEHGLEPVDDSTDFGSGLALRSGDDGCIEFMVSVPADRDVLPDRLWMFACTREEFRAFLDRRGS